MTNNTKISNNSILFSAFLIFLSIVILSGVLFYVAEDIKYERSILSNQLANELKYSECASASVDFKNIVQFKDKYEYRAKLYRAAYIACFEEFNSIYISPFNE